MNRILLSIPCCLLLTSLSVAQPNIILIMCDDLGYGDAKCFHPNTPIATPHIDAMAKDGLKFTRFYAAAPVCSPTRGSCLTGRHPFRYGIRFANDGHLKKEEITLPELLRDQGYTTGHFGKWHLGTLTKTVKDANRGGPKGAAHFAPPSQHGYDESFVTESKVPTYDPMIKPPGAGKNAWDPVVDRSQAVSYGTRYWNHDGSEAEGDLFGDDSKLIMDRALPFIESAIEDNQPFFSVIWFHEPHLPVVASKQHTANYQQFSVYERNYYGCVTALDEQIGRLRSQLAQWQVDDNTMIWFCSDNGPEGQADKAPGLAGGLRGRKRSLYEGGVRVPGILVWPGHVKAGSTTDFAAVTSDYLPTILAVLDVPYPNPRPLDGISLLEAIGGHVHLRRQPIGFESKNQIAWHEGQWKIYSSDGGKSWELYDLGNDPAEAKDLADLVPSKVQTMAKAAQQWRRSCQASADGKDYL